MQINKERFTSVALGFITPEQDYDKVDICNLTARQLGDTLYEELGASKAMSLLDRETIIEIFEKTALSVIDWQRCNRKAQPREYADLMKDGNWVQPIREEW